MQAETLKNMIEKSRSLCAETQTLEFKAASQGCPTKLYDVLSSFSNQDMGGVVVFGVDESKGYEVCGVYDAQDLQKKVSEQCKQMEPEVRALFTVCEIDGKVVVSAEIPGVDVSERPVFYRGTGRIRGAYVRVGEADELMSEHEIYAYEAFRKRTSDDLRPVNNGSWVMINEERVERYLRAVKSQRRNFAENLSDEDILKFMGIRVGGVPTMAGLMTFSKYPQMYFPQLCITAVAIPGNVMGVIGDDGGRFVDNERITGAIPDMLEAAVEFVRRNCRTMTVIDGNGRRADRTEYPLRAVREAVLNALVHRDYSIHSQNTPVSIEMYHNRLEIISPGGLYGRISIEALGKVRPDTRNAALVNVLEMLEITENRYSGIPTIRSEMERESLADPVFKSERGEFRVIMANKMRDETIYGESGNPILDYCSVPRTRDEIVVFSGKSRNYVISQIIMPLVESGGLRLTIPDKPRSKNQKYVRA